MVIYFSSDTHYFHKNVIQYCQRPFENVDVMNDLLIENWNDIVKNDDTVYFLGDLSFGSRDETKNILHELNGTKHLILGNHDEKFSKAWWLSAGFTTVHDYRNICLDHEVMFTMCHYPYNSYGNPHFAKPDAKSYPGLCGHVHERWKVKENTINVGVDVWNYTPVSEHQIVKLWEAMHVK